MKRRALVSLATVAALLLSAGRALAAEEDAGARFRAGIDLRTGLLIAPGVGTLEVFGFQAHAGVQFNNFFGLYALASGAAMFGKLSEGTAPFNQALIVEFTFRDRLYVGVGPEIGWYDVGVFAPELPPTRSGYIYGGRLHVVWDLLHKFADRADWSFWGGSLSTFNVGLDLSLLGGVARFMGAVDASRNATANPLSLMPMVTIGIVHM